MTHNDYQSYQVIIIGAGAAGLFCAQALGKKGLSALVLEHQETAGKKILISGGGRCNFTNLHIKPAAYLSNNPHFCKSALSRFGTQDFLAMLARHQISFYEKKLGQLFCEKSSKDILNMLMKECDPDFVKIQTNCQTLSVAKTENIFEVQTNLGLFKAPQLVIASGGLSFAKLGASDFGYKIARQFELEIIPPRAGLVPFEGDDDFKKSFTPISGVSFFAEVSVGKTSFRDDVLITHLGLSGPAILQISSYWQKGESVNLNLFPDTPIEKILIDAKKALNKNLLHNFLSHHFSERFITAWLSHHQFPLKPVNELSDKIIKCLADSLTHWTFKPKATLGYDKAEVTVGGVSTNEISSKTMECKKVLGLYFIGEILDVTGWLGGYNFQWAWACAAAASEGISKQKISL